MRYLFVLIAFILSCSQPRVNQTQSISGKDYRTAVDSPVIHASVGKITSPFGTCMAFVSGRSELTTALHCVAMAHPSQVTFTNNDGVNIAILSAKEIFPSADIIILNIPQRNQFLATAHFDKTRTLIVPSYDANTQTLVQDECLYGDQESIMFPGVVLHGCKLSKNSPGAPLLQDNKVVGIHVGTVINGSINVAVELEHKSTLILVDVVYKSERACDVDLENHQRFQSQRDAWMRSSYVVSVESGHLGKGFANLLGVPPGTISYSKQHHANISKKEYKNCIQREKEKSEQAKKILEELNAELDALDI